MVPMPSSLLTFTLLACRLEMSYNKDITESLIAMSVEYAGLCSCIETIVLYHLMLHLSELL